jgi:hypothetical protein
VVAVAQPTATARGRTREQPWVAASLLVLAIGCAGRVVIGGVGVASLSAAVLGLVLWVGVWLAALLLANARVAFWVGLAAMLLLTVAALPARPMVDFDERQALYDTDQVIPVPVPSGAATVEVLLEPVFSGASPRFGLAGDVGGTRVAWTCPLRAGLQRVELALPPRASEVRLRLSGTPSRDGDYLVVYTSLDGMSPTASDVVRCSLV